MRKQGEDTLWLLEQMCTQSSSAYADFGNSPGGLPFSSNTLRSPLKTSASRAKSGANKSEDRDTVSFMNREENGIPIDQIVSGKRHMYVSNICGFEVFTTAESKQKVEEMANKLVNIDNCSTQDIQDMWNVVQMFFNSIPLIYFDSNNTGGRARFARYVQTMETFKNVIRKIVFQNYSFGQTDSQKLTPYFIACRIAEHNVKELQKEVEVLENTLQQSVGTSKEEIIAALKSLPEEEQNSLQQYFAKGISFQYPVTPAIGATRHYGENRPFDKDFNQIAIDESRNRAAKWDAPKETTTERVTDDTVKATAKWIGSVHKIKAQDDITYLENELEELQEEHKKILLKNKELETQLQAAVRETGIMKNKLSRATKKVSSQHMRNLINHTKIAGNMDKVILTKEEHKMLMDDTKTLQKELENAMSRIEILESTREKFFSELVASLRIRISRRDEVADTILENIQNILDANEELKIQLAEMELKHNEQHDRDGNIDHKTPKNLRKLLQRAMVTTMKRNRAVNLFKISPKKAIASKTKSVGHRATRTGTDPARNRTGKGTEAARNRPEDNHKKDGHGFIDSHELVVTTNTPFYDVIKTLPSNVTAGVVNDRKIARLISNIYADKIAMDYNFDKIGREHLSLPQFLKTFFIRRCGEKTLALKKLDLLIQSLRQQRNSSTRFNTLAVLLGLEEKDVKNYTPLASGFFLHALFVAVKMLYHHKYEADPNTDTAHQAAYRLDAMKKDIRNSLSDGVQVKTYMSRDQVSQICEEVGFTIPETEKILTNVTRKGLWLIDDFLEYILSFWYSKRQQRRQQNEKLFEQADANGDGILSIDEFKAIVILAEPDVQEVDILALYDFISGVDGTIDKDEFASGMHLVHAQIVKNLRKKHA